MPPSFVISVTSAGQRSIRYKKKHKNKETIETLLRSMVYYKQLDIFEIKLKTTKTWEQSTVMLCRRGRGC